jgi:hypothetical protein
MEQTSAIGFSFRILKYRSSEAGLHDPWPLCENELRDSKRKQAENGKIIYVLATPALLDWHGIATGSSM